MRVNIELFMYLFYVRLWTVDPLKSIVSIMFELLYECWVIYFLQSNKFNNIWIISIIIYSIVLPFQLSQLWSDKQSAKAYAARARQTEEQQWRSAFKPCRRRMGNSNDFVGRKGTTKEIHSHSKPVNLLNFEQTFLRNLPEPLMTFELHNQFINAAKIGDIQQR